MAASSHRAAFPGVLLASAVGPGPGALLGQPGLGDSGGSQEGRSRQRMSTLGLGHIHLYDGLQRSS